MVLPRFEGAVTSQQQLCHREETQNSAVSQPPLPHLPSEVTGKENTVRSWVPDSAFPVPELHLYTVESERC